MEKVSYKVSIVMPVYNVAKYLYQCMDSILDQTLTDIEIIAVNDGSTDNSLEILEEYQEKAPEKIKIYTTENRGVSHARNYGIKKARGEFILFVDSDDFIEAEMCEKLYNKAITDGNDVVICGRYNVFLKGNLGLYNKYRAGTQLSNRNFRLEDHKYELAHISPFPWDKLFKRELIQDMKFPENLRFEDLVFSYQVMCKAELIGVVEEPLYNYRRAREGGFLNSFSEQTLDIIKAIRVLVDSIKEQGYWDIYYEELEYICARHFFYRYAGIFQGYDKGNIELKRRMVIETQALLDKEFPKWRENRYLKYTMGKSLQDRLKLYRSKKKLLRRLFLQKYIPVPIIKLGKKTKNYMVRWKRRLSKKKSIANIKRWIKKKLPFLRMDFRKRAYYTKMYKKLSLSPRDILLESKHGQDIAGNIFAFLMELSNKRYKDYNLKLVLNKTTYEDYKAQLEIYNLGHVNIVDKDSKQYLEALASARYLITDTSFPPYFIKKKGQTLLNTWHGTPLKAMGRIVPSREYALGNVQRNFLISDYLLYQNDFSAETFLRDYMLENIYPGKVLTSGYPRNSIFFNEDRRNQLRKESKINKKQVIVYMPTWRGLLHKKHNDKQMRELLGYFEELDKQLDDDQVFYVKLHPYVHDLISYEGFKHIKKFPREYETYDFLNACDVLVTDYSSIMFDFAVTKRKIILFVYDREEYFEDRGMYLDLDDLELPKVMDVKELVSEINAEPEPYTNFYQKFCSYDSAHTPRQVLDILLDKEDRKTSNIKLSRVGSDKKKLLIFINGMKRNDNARRLIQNINSLNTDKYDIYVCMKTHKIRRATKMLSKFKKEIGYFPINYNINLTQKENLACSFLLKIGLRVGLKGDKLNEVMAREVEKHFGNLHFDYVIHHSEIDFTTALMCQGLGEKVIYNFKHFDYSIYTNSAKYRRIVNRLFKLFPKYSLIVTTKEYYKLGRSKDNIYINEDAEFPFAKVLEEVEA